MACREFQSGVGPADVLILGADGSLVVVECKLASNPQVRREVMGQVLDYASRLWRMPVEEFERLWSDRTGESPFATFGDAAPQARAELQRRLLAGRFMVVLAVDGINADLQRMVEYLNEITVGDVQVLAFEVARVADRDVEILLPRVFGAELAQAKTSISGGAQPSWSEDAYLQWMSESQPALVDVARQVLADARETGFVVENGTASTPSLILGWRGETTKVWPVSIFSTPRCMFQVRVYQVKDVDGDVVALTQALCRVPGSGVDESAYRAAGYRKRADLDLSVLSDQETRTRLLMALATALPS